MRWGIGSDLWIFKEELVQLSPWGKINVEPLDLTDKWALVTGGSTGIGLETAKSLASMGCNVVVTARPGAPGSDKGAKIVQAIRTEGVKTGVTVEFWPHDGESLANTRELAQRWLRTGRPLAFLVSNHGIAEPGLRLTEEGFERHWVINYLSHALLLLLLLPALAKAEGGGRAIGVTSCFHYFGRSIDWRILATTEYEKWLVAPFYHMPPFLMKYGRAKLAMAIFYRELSIRLASQERYRNVILHSVHPGAVDTRLFTDLIEWKQPIIAAFAFAINLQTISTKEGAKSLVKACVSDEDERAVRGGDYWNRAWRTKPRPELDDPATRQRMWKLTLEQLSLKESDVGL